MSDESLDITPEQAADILKIGRLTVFALMDAGRIRSVDIGTGKRKHRRTCRAWLAEFRGANRGADVPETSQT